jgi:hypothetical protein
MPANEMPNSGVEATRTSWAAEPGRQMPNEDAMSDKQAAKTSNDVGPADEYMTLREERLVAKKCVFERPLLILALAAEV